MELDIVNIKIEKVEGERVTFSGSAHGDSMDISWFNPPPKVGDCYMLFTEMNGAIHAVTLLE